MLNAFNCWLTENLKKALEIFGIVVDTRVAIHLKAFTSDFMMDNRKYIV